MSNLHEIEEQEFGRDGALWDAGEGVCCAAFQLGACAHTEANMDDYDDDEEHQVNQIHDRNHCPIHGDYIGRNDPFFVCSGEGHPHPDSTNDDNMACILDAEGACHVGDGDDALAASHAPHCADKPFALRSNHDGRILPERYNAFEAAAARAVQPILDDPGFGDFDLVNVRDLGKDLADEPF